MFEEVLNLAPLGSPHPMPTRFAGLVALNYSSPRILNEKTYEITVEYGPATNRTINLWRRSIRFASETRPFLRTLPEESSNTPSRIVGARSYEPPPDDNSTAPYVALDGQKLVRRPNVLENANLSINDGVTALVYEVYTYQVQTKMVQAISSLKWHTNSRQWLFYPRWSLIFSNWAADDEVAAVPPRPGRAPVAQWFSNVTVEVLYMPLTEEQPYGWRAVNYPDEWKMDGGLHSPVFDSQDNDQILQTFIRYPEVDFYQLFPMFGPGNPGA